MRVDASPFLQSSGQGLPEIGYLLVAFVLAGLIGLERELHQKSAGIRTHTLVGVGAALFMLTSKFGFADVLTSDHVVLDPSRMAAQIVSGIGFIGAGLIFVRRDAVRGLTTAATVWVAAAVGSAAGAGLVVLAAVVTAVHFVVTFCLPPLTRRLPRLTSGGAVVRISYEDGRGALRDVIAAVTQSGFSIEKVTTRRREEVSADTLVGAGRSTELLDDERLHEGNGVIEVSLSLSGRYPIAALIGSLARLSGVLLVSAGDADAEDQD